MVWNPFAARAKKVDPEIDSLKPPADLVMCLLARNLDLDVSCTDAQDLALETRCTDFTDLRAIGLGLVAMVVFKELMVPGDMVVADSTAAKRTCPPVAEFRPWDVPKAQALVRISESWLGLPKDSWLVPGDVCWLELTPKGRELAESWRDAG